MGRKLPSGSERNVFEARRKRARRIARVLARLYPKAGIALVYGSEWELLVSVILSAQCTDKKVNEVTGRLYKRYRNLEEYAKADLREFERDIYQTGFFRAKTKHIVGSAKIILRQYGGKVPHTMNELLTLPGVARKTANVVLGNAFGIVEGIAVDTHVRRLSLKLGLTASRNPKKIERELMMLFPKKEWFDLTYRFIEYGRKVCPAPRHDCREHALSKIYPKAVDTWPRADGHIRV